MEARVYPVAHECANGEETSISNGDRGDSPGNLQGGNKHSKSAPKGVAIRYGERGAARGLQSHQILWEGRATKTTRSVNGTSAQNVKKWSKNLIDRCLAILLTCDLKGRGRSAIAKRRTPKGHTDRRLCMTYALDVTPARLITEGPFNGSSTLPLEKGAWQIPNTYWCAACKTITYTDPGMGREFHAKCKRKVDVNPFGTRIISMRRD